MALTPPCASPSWKTRHSSHVSLHPCVDLSWHLPPICLAMVVLSTHKIWAPTSVLPTPTGVSATSGALPIKVARNALSHLPARCEERAWRLYCPRSSLDLLSPSFLSLSRRSISRTSSS